MEKHAMKNKTNIIIAILIPLAVGAVSAYISRGGMDAYAMVRQPPLSPLNIIFPIVWTILYTLMGISSYIIYASDSPNKDNALKWYGIQLTLNFFWSIIFFRFMLFLAAFIWLIALIVCICIMIYKFFNIKPIAGYLNIPYLLGCIFAAYLNFGVYILNR